MTRHMLAYSPTEVWHGGETCLCRWAQAQPFAPGWEGAPNQTLPTLRSASNAAANLAGHGNTSSASPCILARPVRSTSGHAAEPECPGSDCEMLLGGGVRPGKAHTACRVARPFASVKFIHLQGTGITSSAPIVSVHPRFVQDKPRWSHARPRSPPRPSLRGLQPDRVLAWGRDLFAQPLWSDWVPADGRARQTRHCRPCGAEATRRQTVQGTGITSSAAAPAQPAQRSAAKSLTAELFNVVARLGPGGLDGMHTSFSGEDCVAHCAHDIAIDTICGAKATQQHFHCASQWRGTATPAAAEQKRHACAGGSFGCSCQRCLHWHPLDDCYIHGNYCTTRPALRPPRLQRLC